MSAWQLQVNGHVEGPYTLTQLRQRLEERNVDPNDMVRPVGAESWLPIYLCEELIQNSGSPMDRREALMWKALPWASGAAVLSLLLALVLIGMPDRTPEQSTTPKGTVAAGVGHPSPVAVVTVPKTEPPADKEPREHHFRKPVIDVPELDVPRTPPADRIRNNVVLPEVEEIDDLDVSPRNIAPAITSTRGKAFGDSPFGFGEIRITFAAKDRPLIRPDETLFVVSNERRVVYPAFELDHADGEPHRVSALTARFLIRGEGKLQLSVAAAGRQVGDAIVVELEDNVAQARNLRATWWKDYQQQIDDAPQDQRLVRYFLADALARRVGVSSPAYPRLSEKDHSAIERYFERATGLLFGFDSVLAAMQTDSDAVLTDRLESANQRLPGTLRLASVRMPHFNPSHIEVEAIAKVVPEECFYVRCRSLQNYLWLRELLLNWGGNMSQVVSVQTLEKYTRERIERQLGIHPSLALELGLDEQIQDMALIGCDTFFEDGAALGVVLEASDVKAAARIVARMRGATVEGVPDVSDESRVIGARNVHCLTTPNNLIRSFLVVDGNYILVANCEYIVRRFVERRKTLGNLAEYKYARSKSPSLAEEKTFIYVSDPFFRHIVSPQYRIEMHRRLQAKRDLQQLRVAYVAARAEGTDPKTVDDLVEAGYLPRDFSERPDGASALLKESRVVDSLRGAHATFLPVPDVVVKGATRSEVSAYQKFARDYRREWPVMDPVSVSIGRTSVGDDLESVSLDITITPYARERYAQLARYLAPSNGTRIAVHRDDLLSLNAVIRSGGILRNVSAGLRDREVDFEVANGSVKPLNLTSSSFGRSRFYLAMTPQSRDALHDVGRMLGMKPPSVPLPQKPVVPSTFPVSPVELLVVGTVALTKQAVPMVVALNVAGSIEDRGDWLVMARSAKFRDEIFATKQREPAHSQPMLQFQMRDVTKAKVYPYLRAYTYVTSRQASADNAAALNTMTQQLAIPAEQSLGVAQYLQRAKVVCPLDGQYQANVMSHGPRIWSGTNWPKPSRYEEVEVPRNYKFKFVNWLRALQIDFDLTRTTLHARIEMTVDGS